MAFEATKREWSELYVFFKLLSDGFVHCGTASAKTDEKDRRILCAIEREEHDGVRLYRISGDYISIETEKDTATFPREKFTCAAILILTAIKESSEDVVTSPDEVESFLDELRIYNLDARTQERTNLSLYFWNMEAPSVGVTIRSRFGRMLPLLDGGRAANLKFEVTGMKFSNPMINKVNAVEGENAVTARMLLIQSLGGLLKYADVCDRVFRSNLSMIDLHFPRLLAEMLRMMQLDGITRVVDLVAEMKALNPLKIKTELIQKHLYYEYKVKQLLAMSATGMRPAKIYSGVSSAIQGMILLNKRGELLYYPAAEKNVFEEFLFQNTRFERSDLSKDHYGLLEKENGLLYFRLNAKIGFTKSF